MTKICSFVAMFLVGLVGSYAQVTGADKTGTQIAVPVITAVVSPASTPALIPVTITVYDHGKPINKVSYVYAPETCPVTVEIDSEVTSVTDPHPVNKTYLEWSDNSRKSHKWENINGHAVTVLDLPKSHNEYSGCSLTLTQLVEATQMPLSGTEHARSFNVTGYIKMIVSNPGSAPVTGLTTTSSNPVPMGQVHKSKITIDVYPGLKTYPARIVAH